MAVANALGRMGSFAAKPLLPVVNEAMPTDLPVRDAVPRQRSFVRGRKDAPNSTGIRRLYRCPGRCNTCSTSSPITCLIRVRKGAAQYRQNRSHRSD